MTNPYILVEERANYNISKLERIYRKTPENKWLQENANRTRCLSTQVPDMDTFAEVGEFMGRFNLELALQLAAMKASTIAPVNFNDFLPYLDQTIDFFSCIFSANLDTVNNNSPKGKSFDFGAINLDIVFDFLRIYGRALFGLLEKLAVEIIKKVFIEILSVIDCNNIDKCIVPCDPSENPYKKFLVKPLIKESMNTGLFFAQKIIDGKFNERGFDITDTEMKEYANKAIKRLTPNELECLLKGFMSSDLVQFLIELFKDHTGHDITSREIEGIFEDIDGVVDLVPYTPTTIDNNECGLISLESVARMRLRREGFTEQQITDRMNFAIQESRGRLTTITNFLRALPAPPTDMDAVSFRDDTGTEYRNAPIAVAVINKSIDLMFDAIDVNSAYVTSLLNKLLVYSLGELCLGYYWVNWGDGVGDNSATAGDELFQNPITNTEILTKINNELRPMEAYEIILTQNGTPNFYTKYLTNLEERRLVPRRLNLDNPDAGPEPESTSDSNIDEQSFESSSRERFGGFVIDITEEGTIVIRDGGADRFKLVGSNFTDLSDGTIQVMDYSGIPTEYILTTNRNDILDILKLYNTEKLFSDMALPVQDEADNILFNIYSNVYSFIDESMAKEFFFEEFAANEDVLNKEDFANTDFLNIEVAKQRLKDNINA